MDEDIVKSETYMSDDNTCMCAECGKKIAVTGSNNGNIHKMLCKSCLSKRNAEASRQRAISEAKNKEQAAIYRHEQLEDKLKDIDVCQIGNWQDIPTGDSNTLFVIGNGFDIMHGAKSSFYDFRNSMSPSSTVRWTLETFLQSENIWSDFEDALGHFDINSVAAKEIIYMWVESFDAYTDDARYADIFAAADSAVEPLNTIVYEMPKRFATWIKSIRSDESITPFKDLFKGGKFLNFNYTETLETIYHLDNKNICYIHGCRKCKDKLILGHRMKSIDEYKYMEDSNWIKRTKNNKDHIAQFVQENVIEKASEIYDDLAKDCNQIIGEHREFFDSLVGVDKVVVIGHSMSYVDMPYFKQINKQVGHDAKWYFGCFCVDDVNRALSLANELNLSKKNICIFATDEIAPPRSDQIPTFESKPTAVPKSKQLDVSCDGKFSAQSIGYDLCITSEGETKLMLEMPSKVNYAAFFNDSEHTFLLAYCKPQHLFLFATFDTKWRFVGEIDDSTGRCPINRRLRKIILKDDELVFVYNNRIVKWSVSTAQLVCNNKVMHAKDLAYDGVNLTNKLRSSGWWENY